MAASAPQRVFPFSAGGAAAGLRLPTGPVHLTDLTSMPRFGLKGLGSAAWLTAQDVSLPAINRIGAYRGMRVLRLGSEDIVFLAAEAGYGLDLLKAAWAAETGPRGYLSWRDEGWAWMRVSGAGFHEAMAALCAVDLRPQSFGADQIAQTRVGHIEAITFRSESGFDILFDITASAQFVRAVAVARSCVVNLDLEED